MTVVGILGVTHDPEMQAKYHYPLSLMEELIGEFAPDVICGEVHPQSWRLYLESGEPYGILGETQEEYPRLIFPYCHDHRVEFVPVNWFEEDVFEGGPFDPFDPETQQRLTRDLTGWKAKQLATWNRGRIPFNSFAYDAVTQKMYAWLHTVNPDVQDIQWNARHNMMLARVKKAIEHHRGQRILCIHGADHNYWYHNTLAKKRDVRLVYPLR